MMDTYCSPETRGTERDPYVEQRYAYALWYAFGRLDERDPGHLESDLDAFAFARRHQSAAMDYRAERATSLASITDAWTTYVRHVETLVTERETQALRVLGATL